MKTKEKAIYLVDKFYQHTNTNSKERAKACALIAVDEILKAVTTIADKKYDYFIEVKKEIEKL